VALLPTTWVKSRSSVSDCIRRLKWKSSEIRSSPWNPRNSSLFAPSGVVMEM
jgi:hypothetical protein